MPCHLIAIVVRHVNVGNDQIKSSQPLKQLNPLLTVLRQLDSAGVFQPNSHLFQEADGYPKTLFAEPV